MKCFSHNKINKNPLHVLRIFLEQICSVRLLSFVKILDELNNVLLSRNIRRYILRVILKTFKIFTWSTQAILKSKRIPSSNLELLPFTGFQYYFQHPLYVEPFADNSLPNVDHTANSEAPKPIIKYSSSIFSIINWDPSFSAYPVSYT